MNESDDRRLARIALYVIAALTVIQFAVLVVSPLQLYPDEAQYWWWAQAPDFGYFSKPPLIAWIIWATTAIFGDAEWAIRLASPLLHGGTALILFAVGKRVGDARLGLWSALAYATLPGVSYSSGLVSTDVPLLFCWAAALYAFLRALDERGWGWPLLCGIALGYGMLAKYAMAYFVAGALVAAIVSPRARRLVLSLRGLVIVVMGLLVLAPNIAWNAARDFPTVSQAATNAGWGHPHFDVVDALSFVGSQFGVFGPILMAGFLVALWRLARGPKRPDGDLILAAFALPPLVIMTAQGFISHANANWAAAAYVSATPLAVAVLLATARRWALWLSFAVDGLPMVVLWLALAWPVAGSAMGLGNVLKREEGWRELCTAIDAVARAGHFDAIVPANSAITAEMTYYGRPLPVPLRMWNGRARPADHFQMTMPLSRGPWRVLLVLLPEQVDVVPPSFESAKQIGAISIPLGDHHREVTLLYDARGFKGPAPLR